MNKQNKTDLLLLVGVSGCGKSTVAETLCSLFDFQEIPSHTTRLKRTGEKDQYEVSAGEKPAYFFISEEEFLEKVNNGEFIENVKFGTAYYGVHKSNVLEGSRIVLVVEPEGAKQITKFYKNSETVNVTLVYLNISLETQIQRMLNRGDTKEMIDKRLSFDDIRERAPELNFDLVFNTEKYSALKIANLINTSIEE